MKHLYSLRYRRADHPNRLYRLTVIARSADEARAYAQIIDPLYGSTVASPRRGRAVVDDREFVEFRGTQVEVVD